MTGGKCLRILSYFGKHVTNMLFKCLADVQKNQMMIFHTIWDVMNVIINRTSCMSYQMGPHTERGWIILSDHRESKKLNKLHYITRFKTPYLIDTLEEINTQAASVYTILMPTCNNKINKISLFPSTIRSWNSPNCQCH